jgi:hypothetical protein
LLLDAKTALLEDSGGLSWKSWVEDYLPDGLSPSTCNKYIRLFEHQDLLKDAKNILEAEKLLPRVRAGKNNNGKGKDKGKDANANAGDPDINKDDWDLDGDTDTDANDDTDADTEDNDNANVGRGRGGYADAGDLDTDRHLDPAFVAQSAENFKRLEFLLRAGVPLLTQSHKQALRRLVLELTDGSVLSSFHKKAAAENHIGS